MRENLNLNAGQSVDAEQGTGAAQTSNSRAGASCEGPVSRREFVAGIGAAAVESAMLSRGAWASPSIAAPHADVPVVYPVPVSLRVNGDEKHATVDPRTSLLDFLRNNLQLTGTKKGCDHGQCGSCTVLLNGRRVNSCLTLAVSVDGDSITTIEGLAQEANSMPFNKLFLITTGFSAVIAHPARSYPR